MRGIIGRGAEILGAGIGLCHGQLFDHAADPLNRIDIAADRPEIVDRLAQVLGNWRGFARSARLSATESTEGMSAEELEKLRSLGYI